MEIEEIPEISSEIISPIFSILVVSSIASTIMSSGKIIDGDVVSTTVIFWDCVEEFPDSSVTFHVTMVSPNGNLDGASFIISTSCIS